MTGLIIKLKEVI